MLKIGVLGAGHLGKIHIKCIQESNLLDLVGFYDPDAQAAAKAEAEYNTRCFPDISSLIGNDSTLTLISLTLPQRKAQKPSAPSGYAMVTSKIESSCSPRAASTKAIPPALGFNKWE